MNLSKSFVRVEKRNSKWSSKGCVRPGELRQIGRGEGQQTQQKPMPESP